MSNRERASRSRGTKRRFVLVVGIGSAGLLCLLTPRRWMAFNDVTTGRTPAYPEIVPHIYRQPPATVYAAGIDAMRHMRRWRIVGQEPEAGRIEAEIRTFLFDFTDDVNVWIEQEGSGSRVMIRSHSRVGKGDLGENARTIQALQAEMDRRLPQ